MYVLYKLFDKFPFWKYYTYSYDDVLNYYGLWLSCSLPSGIFDRFANCFDSYNKEMKKCLLSSNNTHVPVLQISIGDPTGNKLILKVL